MTMEIILLSIIILILLAILLINLSQLKKQKQETDDLQEKIESLTKDILQQKKDLLESLERQSSNTWKDTKELLENFIEKNSHSFNDMLADFSMKLDQELKAEEAQINHWLTYIDSLSTREERIEALESSINKYPYAKALVMKYMMSLTPLLDSDNAVVKKRALEKANRVARTFLDNCEVKDYPTAIQMFNDIVEQGKQFMTASYEKRVEHARQQLDAIDKKVTDIENSSSVHKDSLVAELEEMENRLDRSIIEKVKVLTSEYHRISKRIISALAEDNKEEQMKQYNLDAISNIQMLHYQLQANAKAFRKGRVEEIARVLGEWDTTYFTPQTNTYYQYVYQEFFNNLHPDEKPRLTESVLKMDKKRVG